MIPGLIEDFFLSIFNLSNFNKLGSGPPRKIHTKFEANLCTGLREVKNGILQSDILLNFVKHVTYLPRSSLA